MKKIIIALMLLFVLSPVFSSNGTEHVVFYRLGEKDPDAWNLLRKYFQAKGYSLTVYEGTSNLDRHIENVNKINRGTPGLFVALDFRIGDRNSVMVAVTGAKRERGSILSIEEVPAVHEIQSRECARSVAESFQKGPKELSLFPLLGVDMPGIFVKMECTREKISETFEAFYGGLQRYFARGTKNEN
jgi:hypothetical protein